MERAAKRKIGRTAGIERLEQRLLFTASELIRNGSFEGPTPSDDWVMTGNFHADSTFTNPHSGLGYAYVADPTSGASLNNASGTMSQQVIIPSTSTALSLSFWTKISTTETTTTAQNDTLQVQITDASGTTVLSNIATLSNLNSSSSYVQHVYTLSTSLYGQMVKVTFKGQTNASLATTFRVDDVGLRYAPLPTTQRVVGYIIGSTGLSKIDLNDVTWLNYFSMSMSDDGSLGTVNNSTLASVVNASHAKGVGVSICMVMPSPYTALPSIGASPTARANFANNILAFIQSHNLDGVDLDWEPAATGVKQADYAMLIDALYLKLHPFGYTITSASNPITHEIPVAAVNEMDWVNVMCYDFDYANVAPYTDTINGMNGWATYGVPKSKLVMGLPFYGRYGTSWSDTHSKSYGDSVAYGSSTTVHILSDYQSLYGILPPMTLDSYVDGSGHTVYFNGVNTIQKKMAFARDNGFGGAMIWELEYDHWNASSQYDPYSLLPVVSSMLRPPSWLAPDPGSMYDVVNGQFLTNTGSVTMTADASTANPNLNMTVGTGSKIVINAPQRLASLTTSGTGSVDLKNNSIVMDYTGASTPLGAWNGTAYTGLTGLIKSGRNGGAWNGPGITTSMTSAKSPSSLATIGIAEASAALGITGSATKLWNGRTVDATTVLIRYTLAGDANLDGKIDGDDYFKIDSGISSHATGYANGDFNYDGRIDADDYFIIDSHYSKNAVALSAPMTVAATTPATTGIFRDAGPIGASAADALTHRTIDDIEPASSDLL